MTEGILLRPSSVSRTGRPSCVTFPSLHLRSDSRPVDRVVACDVSSPRGRRDPIVRVVGGGVPQTPRVWTVGQGKSSLGTPAGRRLALAAPRSYGRLSTTATVRRVINTSVAFNQVPQKRKAEGKRKRREGGNLDVLGLLTRNGLCLLY